MKPVFKLPTLALLSALLGFPLPILAATAPAASSNSALPAASQTRVNDAQLSRFVTAYQAVSQIRKQWMIETHGLKDESKIAALKKQAEKKMKAAILEYLKLGEYVRIGKAVNADPKLHARFMEMRETAALPPIPATG
ncbi:MAG: DUF4168 domain-containing protein [Gammaproteobacteria bacterium]|nr:DUF4168 domain-containing protein [Gammaproteobacteria bacterium]